ncbi:hypothetical protein Nepgr_028443 [Nepenthes gracilis]|uniref:EDR1/CTR1/ARMC3-like peptidase-like domain-containing protein n=1 Tax=Nepenthes gracilis TaxID=150966 RepID=A0AAD3TAC5_NEPGR|nr:hypothetical protein Nepgr_028443 [Nepenthes gracilis]
MDVFQAHKAEMLSIVIAIGAGAAYYLYITKKPKEKALVDSAVELGTELENVASEISSLFAKIDQNDRIEDGSRILIQNFLSKLTQQLEILCKVVAINISQQEQQLKNIGEDMKTFVHTKAELFEQIASEANALPNDLQSGLHDQEEKIIVYAQKLLERIADLVVHQMGGLIGDTDEMIKRCRVTSNELRNSLNTVILPLGRVDVGLSRYRSLLFKVLADRINLPCMLVKGSLYTGTDDGAVHWIKIDDGVSSSGSINKLSLVLHQVDMAQEVLPEVDEIPKAHKSRLEEAISVGFQPKHHSEHKFEKLVPSEYMSIEASPFSVEGSWLAQEHKSTENAVLLESGASPSPDSNNYWLNNELLIIHYVLNQKIERLGLAAIEANSGSPNENPGAAILPGITKASEADTPETDGGASYQKSSEEYSLPAVFDSSNAKVGCREDLSRMKGLLSVQAMKESLDGSRLPPRVHLLPPVFAPDFYAINAVQEIKLAWVVVELWSGLILGSITTYCPSHADSLEQNIADACLPRVANPAVAPSGLLDTIPIGLAMDVYGPNNNIGVYGCAWLGMDGYAGGIAEMVGIRYLICTTTDTLAVATMDIGIVVGSSVHLSLVFPSILVDRPTCTTPRNSHFNLLTVASIEELKTPAFEELLKTFWDLKSRKQENEDVKHIIPGAHDGLQSL